MFGLNKKKNRKGEAAVGGKINNSIRISDSLGLLKRPVVSEKALSLENRGEYVFTVTDDANKLGVKKEIEKKYNVKVVRVNMIVSKPKRKIFRGRVGYRTGFKKALVKLAAGQKIEVLPK